MKIRKVAIRTDGSLNTGLGHVMRCVTLAEEFQKNNIEVVFFVEKNEVVEKLLNEKLFRVFVLEDDEQEEENILKHLKIYNICLLILDTFNATEQYVAKLRKGAVERCFIVILDNLRLGKFSADVLVNGSIYANSWYKEYLQDDSYLLGPQYAILQPEYQKSDTKKIKEKAENILITMGGTDPKQLTGKIMSFLLNIEDIELTILVGKGFQNVDNLIELSYEEPRVKLIFDSTSIKPFLENCDVAITAGGTTTYETASIGIPSALFLQADNQELPAQIFNEEKLMINFGYYKEENEEIYIKRLLDLFNNQKERQQMNKKLQELVDGKGTERIITMIILLYKKWSDKI